MRPWQRGVWPFHLMDQWYANLLTDHRWLAKRREQLKIDGYKCQSCGKGLNQVTLVVHHLGYVFGYKPWDYPHSMLQTLCMEHHNQVHEGKKPHFIVCCHCNELTPDVEANGRDGKHEWICETCIRDEAEAELAMEGHEL